MTLVDRPGEGRRAASRAPARRWSSSTRPTTTSDVPLQERRREDAWRPKRTSSWTGKKFRAGAIIIPNADRATLEPMLKDLGLSAWAVAAGADGQDARPRPAAHRLRAQLEAHAGRRLGARRARHLRRAVHLLRRPEAARGQPAREVRRDHLPARRRHRAVAGERHGR